MSNEIIKQAEEFFKDKEQWYSFLDLVENKNRIRDSWFTNLKEKINKCFAIDHVDEKWGYVSINLWDYRWFIKKYGKDSICLYFDGKSLCLWVNSNYFDSIKVTEYLQQEKYIPIISAFERQDEINASDNENKVCEHGNFRFIDEYDGYFDYDRLAWFAKYKSDELVQQLLIKIDKFRKNSLVTDLIIEINELTKK